MEKAKVRKLEFEGLRSGNGFVATIAIDKKNFMKAFGYDPEPKGIEKDENEGNEGYYHVKLNDLFPCKDYSKRYKFTVIMEEEKVRKLEFEGLRSRDRYDEATIAVDKENFQNKMFGYDPETEDVEEDDNNEGCFHVKLDDLFPCDDYGKKYKFTVIQEEIS
jgi:hypothetical protein